MWDYLREHDLPYNPLHDQGYPSIGCYPCHRPVAAGSEHAPDDGLGPENWSAASTFSRMGGWSGGTIDDSR